MVVRPHPTHPTSPASVRERDAAGKETYTPFLLYRKVSYSLLHTWLDAFDPEVLWEKRRLVRIEEWGTRELHQSVLSKLPPGAFPDAIAMIDEVTAFYDEDRNRKFVLYSRPDVGY